MSSDDRDSFFMDVAVLFGTRSTCPRAQVGAVAVQQRRIISSGYVGAPSGLTHCNDPGESCIIINGGCVRTVHAEANVVAFAARAGLSLDGATLYTTVSPCLNCAKLIANAGIFRVVYGVEYRETQGMKLLEAMGVELAFESGSQAPLEGTPQP